MAEVSTSTRDVGITRPGYPQTKANSPGGLLLRHLVMPGMLAETEAVLRFVAEELGPDTYVDLMAQDYPAGRVGGDGRGRLRRDRPALVPGGTCARSRWAVTWAAAGRPQRCQRLAARPADSTA
jgi:hypothetical protein